MSELLIKGATLVVTLALLTIGSGACTERQPGRPGPGREENKVMGKQTTVEKMIVALERGALEQFGRGEIEGPLVLCDEEITYFDPSVESRLEGREALAVHYEPVRGKPQYARFELVDPRVQVFGDTSILTYVLETRDTPNADSPGTLWKVTAVYHRFDGGWRVVHSHFGLYGGTTPRDFQVASPPAALERLGNPLLHELMGLEDAAMQRWRRGDPWAFWQLSAPDVTYFDPETRGRINNAEGLRELYAGVEGKIRYDVSEYFDPRVQPFGDTAVLSYQYRSATRRDDGSAGNGTLWNTTEVFARRDGRWRIVHTHWSYARAGTA